MILYLNFNEKKTILETNQPSSFDHLKELIANHLKINGDEMKKMKISVPHPRSGTFYEIETLVSRLKGDECELLIEQAERLPLEQVTFEICLKTIFLIRNHL